MVGGFRVVCNLNTLVIDRATFWIYIFIENPIYLLHFSVWYCCKPTGDIIGCWLE